MNGKKLAIFLKKFQVHYGMNLDHYVMTFLIKLKSKSKISNQERYQLLRKIKRSKI